MALLGLVLFLSGIAGVVVSFLALLLTGKRWLAFVLPALLASCVLVFVGAGVREAAHEEAFADRCIELGGVVGRPGELCLTRWSDGTSPVIEVP